MDKEIVQKKSSDAGSRQDVHPLQLQAMPRQPRGLKIEPFRYASLVATNDTAITSIWHLDPEEEEEVRAQKLEHERNIEQEANAKKIWQDAYAKGLSLSEQEHAAQLAKVTAQVEVALKSFEAEREKYFSKVEREVVELSLAIAARILQREAQMDPLLLAGAVRVALGSLHESTAVQIRVPSSSCALWTEAIAKMTDLAVHPEVVAEDSLKDGDAVIETKLGNVDLGLRAQLKEVERGFFDLLAHREPAQNSLNGKQAR